MVLFKSGCAQAPSSASASAALMSLDPTTEHLLLRRSFELISLSFARYYSLNLFLGPFIFNSPSSVSTRSDREDVPRCVVLPTESQNLTIRNHVSENISRNESGTVESVTSIGEFVRKHCPSLFRPWEPTWWLNR